MSELKMGDRVRILNGGECKVLAKLGEGGQGIVYKVSYEGKEMALKWYFIEKMKNPKQFYSNLQRNIEQGAPTDSFLWPQELSEYSQGESFGYLMELRPQQYEDFSRFLLARVRFSSVSALINAGLNMVEGFRALHNRGYSYQDLNDGNFFINPQSGDVLICDNDNVAPYGENLGIDKNNEGQGLTWRQVKINSKNLQKLMKKRGLSQFDTTQLKKSFAKWDGQNNHKGGNVTARHAKANEKYVITQTKGESASGVFVSKKSLGNSPQERIDKGALPPSNKANQEKRVALGKNQNVISGKIAQQPSFKEQDTAHGERRGGGKQVVTAGGFSTGAVKNINKNGGKKMASSEKDRGNAFKQSLKVNVPQGQAKSSGKKNAFNNSPSKGQRERTRSQSQTKSKGMSR